VTKPKVNYLSLTGYRLPTEAEIEYATRAGAATSRFYGETEALLPKYAWYLKNSQGKTWPVGTLKPNDLGLFDIHGNVYSWCQERYHNYPQGKGEEVYEDKEEIETVSNADYRAMRGGSFNRQGSTVRSADRNSYVPATRDLSYGFRPARTFWP
jgi:formylglycine-generating enzyme required for sulfatase activity